MSEKVLKLKTESFITKLQEIIKKDEVLGRINQWPKKLEAFTEFSYIDEHGIKITLIHDCERVN